MLQKQKDKSYFQIESVRLQIRKNLHWNVFEMQCCLRRTYISQITLNLQNWCASTKTYLNGCSLNFTVIIGKRPIAGCYYHCFCYCHHSRFILLWYKTPDIYLSMLIWFIKVKKEMSRAINEFSCYNV